MNYDALIKALQPLVQRVRTDKTAVKGARGQAWTDEPLHRAHLRHHLNGGPARGVCPIKEGENTTSVGLLDFDSHKGEAPWAEMQEAAAKVMDTLRDQGLTPIPWRSSGGRGIHVYVLWDQPQDAYTVRQVLKGAIGACGFGDGAGGVKAGQVEVFPKQDAVPVGGYGNQFILPLAGKSEPLDALDLEPMGRDPGCIVWPASPPLAKREKPPKPAPTALVDSTLAGQALNAITNDGSHPDEASRDWWFQVLCAAKEAGVSEGDAEAWSDRYGGAPGAFTKAWNSITVGREDGVPADHLFKVAEVYGFTEHTRQMFDDISRQVAEARPLKFRFQRLGELVAEAPLQWIIKGVLPRAQLGVIYGASGSGKSFAVFDMAMSIARGIPWRDKRTTPTQVAYIVAEGSKGFSKRVRAYAQHHDIDPNEVGVHGLTAAPNLGNPADVGELIRGIQAVGEVGLIIIDTLAQTTPAADENAGKDMNPIIKRCQAISEATDALVLMVHHSGKDAAKGARGWSGIRAALDVELEVVRQATGRCIRLTKSKDDIDGLQWGFDLEVVTVGVDSDGDAITSCVVREAEVPSAVPAKELGPNEKVVNDVIQEMAKAQTEGLEVRWILSEAVKRMPEPTGGKRDTRRQRAARALENLCLGDQAPYWRDEHGNLSII